MTAMVFLIEQTAPGLYILLGVGIFWCWRKWVEARHAYRATTFELERDLARYRSGNAFTALVVLIEIALVVVGVEQVVAPTVREDITTIGAVVEFVQADDGVFATPTRPAPSGEIPIDASGVDFGGQEVAAIFATPTLTPTPVGTIEPNAPAPRGCNTPNATLQIPANGMRVFQPIRVVGTAYIDNFSNYKLEIGRGGQFYVLDDVVVPVGESGTLSQFNPAPYEAGTYQFRLMVFDNMMELKASCEVTIYISDPIPTPTPIG